MKVINYKVVDFHEHNVLWSSDILSFDFKGLIRYC